MLAALPLYLALAPSPTLLHPRTPGSRFGSVNMRVSPPSVDQLSGTPVEEGNGGWFERSGSEYAEQSRQYRRTVYMHDEWVKHRSSERFIKNLKTITKSGVGQSLGLELNFVTATAVFCVLANMALMGYQDFGGVVHTSPLQELAIVRDIHQLALPAIPFTIGMPALSLLLVFRTNTAYSRWNEARTLWGGVVNSCRNVVRQSNTFFPENETSEALKDVLAANTAAFAKALRNFLRGPTDDAVFKAELMKIVDEGLMTVAQVEACMAAKNRPMFQLNAMSSALKRADLEPMDRSRIDATITTLVDLTGACERIFKSPVPLVYTRHTSRFLTTFLLFLPFGLWPAMGDSWNHWATVPATTVVAFFLLGIEEIGMQIEEPFSILPLEALCNGAIAATIDELLSFKRANAYDLPRLTEAPAAPVLAAAAAEPAETFVGTVQPVNLAALETDTVKEKAAWKAGSFAKLWGK